MMRGKGLNVAAPLNAATSNVRGVDENNRLPVARTAVVHSLAVPTETGGRSGDSGKNGRAGGLLFGDVARLRRNLHRALTHGA
jgi:hypothetical protein